jgi:nucleotidyltransferase/DNA polymerase involved in DNA repair
MSGPPSDGGSGKDTDHRNSHRSILHVDMDAFFAAIEVREDPTLAGRPVVVGADPRGGRGRGVVSTANYEARRFGIHSAMPISEAYRRCPHAAYVYPRGSLYGQVSKRIFEIMRAYTDCLEPLSLDEAFLDVTGSRALFGDGPTIAAAIKHDIQKEQRLTASVGVAAIKYVAKVASDLEKPDGLVVVEPGREAEFLAPLPIARLWGAGAKAQERFERLRLRTIGEVARIEPEVLEATFGQAMGRRFHRLANGIDHRSVNSHAGRKSLGHEVTFDHDLEDRERVERTLLRLCEKVGSGLRHRGLAGRTVQLKIRWDGFETVTRQRPLPRSVDTTERIWPVARELFREADRPERRVRLIGVTATGLEMAADRQLALFEPGLKGEEPAEDHAQRQASDERVASAVDQLADRFGPGTITRAALLKEGRGR